MNDNTNTGLTKLTTAESLESYIQNIKNLEIIADTVAKSETWSEAFKIKDKDGNMSVSKGAIISSLMIGLELGFSPMTSLMLGTKINPNSILAVQRGKAMGFTATDSLSLIHTIESKGKVLIYAGVHAIRACLLKHGVTHKWIKTYDPVYKYYDAMTLTQIPEDEIIENGIVKPQYWIYNNVEADALTASSAGKTVVLATYQYHESVVEFTRTYPNKTVEVRTYRYDSLMAAQAGKIPVQLTDGSWTEGKDTWNTMPVRMYTKEVYINGARDIASDIIYNTYSDHEIADFMKDSTIIDTTAEEV